MAQNEIVFEILAQTAEATKEIAAFQKKTQKSLETIESSTNSIKFTSLITGVNAAFDLASKAFGAVAEAITPMISAAVESEDNITKLNTALALSGRYSKETSKQFELLAEQIEATTRFSDDAVISAAALAQRFANSTEQSKALVKAAVDLSAVTGQDLNSSVEALGKTLDGTVGRIAESVPELQNLSASALRSGAAIGVVAERFKGAAQELGGTFEGRVIQTKNAFDNLLETLGGFITKDQSVVSAIGAIGKELSRLNGLIKDQKGLSVVGETINLLASAFKIAAVFASVFADVIFRVIEAFYIFGNALTILIEGTITTIANLAGAIAVLDFSRPINGFKDVASAASKQNKDIIGYFDNFRNGFDQIVKSASNIQGALSVLPNKVGESFDKAGGSIKKFNATFLKVNENLIALTDNVARLKDVVSSGIDKSPIKTALNFIFTSTTKTEKDIATAKLDLMQKIAKEQASIDKQIADRKKDIDKTALRELFNERQRLEEKAAKIAAAAPLGQVSEGLSFAFKGIEGARKLVGDLTAGTIAFLSQNEAIGKAAGEILVVLSQGPEKVSAMVREFLNAIPLLVKNILQSIPALIETVLSSIGNVILSTIDSLPLIVDELVTFLVDRLPVLVEALVEKIPEIVNHLILALEKIAPALVTLMPRVANALAFALIANAPSIAASFARELILNTPQIVAGFASELAKLPGRLIDELARGINDIFKGIGGGVGGVVSGVVSGGGGILSDIGNFFGFAEGGLVPSGFNNDTFPARLTSGELVIERSTTQKLDQFLNNQGGSQGPVVVQLFVGEKQLADVMLDLNRKGFRTA